MSFSTQLGTQRMLVLVAVQIFQEIAASRGRIKIPTSQVCIISWCLRMSQSASGLREAEKFWEVENVKCALCHDVSCHLLVEIGVAVGDFQATCTRVWHCEGTSLIEAWASVIKVHHCQGFFTHKRICPSYGLCIVTSWVNSSTYGECIECIECILCIWRVERIAELILFQRLHRSVWEGDALTKR